MRKRALSYYITPAKLVAWLKRQKKPGRQYNYHGSNCLIGIYIRANFGLTPVIAGCRKGEYCVGGEAIWIDGHQYDLPRRLNFIAQGVGIGAGNWTYGAAIERGRPGTEYRGDFF